MKSFPGDGEASRDVSLGAGEKLRAEFFTLASDFSRFYAAVKFALLKPATDAQLRVINVPEPRGRSVQVLLAGGDAVEGGRLRSSARWLWHSGSAALRPAGQASTGLE